MDEKKLDHLLHEMKYDYERLPEFVDKQDIINKVEPNRSVQIWRRILPSISAVLGLVIFSIISSTYIDWDRQQTTQGNQGENENPNEFAEDSSEIDEELQEYLTKAKKELGKETGLENVDELWIVTQVDQTIKDLKNHHEQTSIGNSLDETKEYIDAMLTPPQKMIEILSKNPEEESLLRLLRISPMYRSAFSEYMGGLLLEYRIDVSSYSNMVEIQDEVQKYEGPEEIKRFLDMLNEQGYELTIDSTSNNLIVEIDYDYLKSEVHSANFDEAYTSYIDLAAIHKFKSHYYNGSLWEDYDRVILDIETYLTNYGNDISSEFRDYVFSEVLFYLDSYIQGGDGSRPLLEEYQLELKQFVENNTDSFFWHAVNEAVKSWEENDWMQTEVMVDRNKMKILFREPEVFGNVEYDDIIQINRWPFSQNTVDLYQEYKTNLDTSLLEGLDPIETMSLYTYAYQKGDEKIYTSLTYQDDTINSKIHVNEWWEANRQTDYVAIDYINEDRANVYFIAWQEDIELVTSLVLKKADGIWKVHDNTINE